MSETVQFIVSDDYAGATLTTQNLSDGSLCKVVDIRGRGLSQVDHNIIGSPSAFGGQFAGVQWLPREITLSIIFETDSAANAVIRRDAIYELFKPFNPALFQLGINNERGCWLKITRGDSSVRQIKCQTMGIVDFPIIASDPVNNGEQSAGVWRGKTTVKLLCPDPFWYDPTVVTETDALSGTFSGSFNVSVSGTTAFMYPVFTLVGPVSEFIISDGINGIILGAITGSETITIDLRPFAKTIYDNSGDYRFDLLTSGFNAAFAKFSILPTWNGSTTLNYSGTGASGSASAKVEYYKRYVAA